ncbi:PREDICTED: PHD finger protein MALE MEIOCYTE DEATH 1 [Populus euphratica]|uniref:PHD finger protein MALE MEIOCYTE DEATH 1 n=1 Tax=Populus euphratica TaxID=75702 RepID=A0AAJ6UY22_POPEU|nr:PREDICTED: PHD finger protein MALE MEIOCYTE DEATH 1 [Populus euphratica]
MSIPNLENCKKRKRWPKLYDFNTFCEPDCPINPRGPFRDNMRLFLQQCAEPEDYKVEGMSIWCTLLVIESKNFVVPLYTIEEDVKESVRPFCDLCRCNGWSHNSVSKRKYHMIIPVDSEWSQKLEDGVCDLQTHLLHGLIHCNGFGHLLCINGREGGSKYLCGREIMDLWDRICASLRTRKITVEDVSKKRSMDLRLLYGIAYGHPWFGRWGYKFCHGSFGVTEPIYFRAIEILSTMELEKIIQDFSDTSLSKSIKQIIHYYKDLSPTQLITFKDFLRFMLAIRSCPCVWKKQSMTATTTSKPPINIVLRRKPLIKEKCMKYRNFSSLVGTMDSRWPTRRLQYAAEVIVDALKAKKEDKHSQEGMTRQDVRDAARMHIGDTGLLDYVLKSMNNVVVGKYVVQRAVNPKTRILEYSIEEFGDGIIPVKSEPESETVPAQPLLPGADVNADVVFVYENVLFNYPESELVEVATQAILDSKHFVKEWPFRVENDQLLSFICQVMPTWNDLEAKFHRKAPPGEIIVLPLHASVLELKQEAESALRDTYCMLESFVVIEIEHMENLDDKDLLCKFVKSGAEIFVKGYGMDINSQLRYEGGSDNWKVRCECGACDDDGERMVECDICEVWQHTRCNGIDDADTVPQLFICSGCCDSLLPGKTETHQRFESSDDLLMIPAAIGYGAEAAEPFYQA